MLDQTKFFIKRLQERLWVKPAIICVVSIIAVLMAMLADKTWLTDLVPVIDTDAIKKLLSILSSSMLVISTFSVASMLAAYNSASSTATPRSFSLILSDDVSQNALSVFIGAFIYSLVATIVFENNLFGKAGKFVIFLLTLLVFIIVILIFIRWVDSIARLGRMESTIKKIEKATINSMSSYHNMSTLGCRSVKSIPDEGRAIYSDTVGYVQYINMEELQGLAEKYKIIIRVNASPGTFCCNNRALVYLVGLPYDHRGIEMHTVKNAFVIDDQRKFDHDPRFGFITLSEISGRALSPGVNDPGTAISIIGTMVRIFTIWHQNTVEQISDKTLFTRIEVPELSIEDMFQDAFNVTARDGASVIEVMIRLQKALKSLAALGDAPMTKAAIEQADKSFTISTEMLNFEGDRIILEQVYDWRSSYKLQS